MRVRRLCASVCVAVAPWGAPQAWADDWLGQDKAQHLLASAAFSTAVTVATARPDIGFWTGVAAGALKEVWDRNRSASHEASGRDFLWSVAGAYVGSQGGGWLLRRSGGETVLAYAWRF